MPLTNEEKIGTLKKIFSTDIEEFGKFFFPNHLRLKTPDFHKELYQILQSDRKRIGWGAPRGHAKSTVIDLVYLAWAIVNQKARFILLVSDTYTQASLFLESLKAEFEANEELRGFYGNLVSDKWSEGEVVVGDIMVKAIGANMKVRGLKYKESRPDLVVCDDLENDEMVESQERREKFERWFNAALVPSMAKDGRIVVIGTIMHYDSLLSKILHPDQYQDFYKKTYQAITDDKALWPEHLNLLELDKIKQEFISKGQGYLFYREYMNDPVSGEHRKFKLEKFRYITPDLEMELQSKQLINFITVDRAYSMEKVADFTGLIVVSVDRENNWYVRLAERFKGTENAIIDKIFDLHSYFHPQRVGIEQKAFKYTLKPALEDEMRKRNTFFNVVELKDLARKKNVRIEGLIPRFETGSIYIKNDQVDLIDELIKFPAAKHDDLIDALSYCLEIAGTASLGAQARTFYPKMKSPLESPIVTPHSQNKAMTFYTKRYMV